jgi:hypothetical protein
MTKKEARKTVLKEAAKMLRSDDFDAAVGVPSEGAVRASGNSDHKKIRAEIDRLATHLEWEADGRPER